MQDSISLVELVSRCSRIFRKRTLCVLIHLISRGMFDNFARFVLRNFKMWADASNGVVGHVSTWFECFLLKVMWGLTLRPPWIWWLTFRISQNR